MHLFGGDQREAVGQVESHLVSEQAASPGAGAVGLGCALVEYQPQQVLVRRGDRHAITLAAIASLAKPGAAGRRDKEPSAIASLAKPGAAGRRDKEPSAIASLAKPG